MGQNGDRFFLGMADESTLGFPPHNPLKNLYEILETEEQENKNLD